MTVCTRVKIEAKVRIVFAVRRIHWFTDFPTQLVTHSRVANVASEDPKFWSLCLKRCQSVVLQSRRTSSSLLQQEVVSVRFLACYLRNLTLSSQGSPIVWSPPIMETINPDIRPVGSDSYR